ncbi:MAG: hypothetical protein WC536_00260 [Patescibacteria group bacterium]
MLTEKFVAELRKNWDLPQDYRINKSSGEFADQEEKLNKLKHLIKTQRNSVLICGERGAGKTSLAYHAIRLASQESNSNKIKLIPVIINANQLNAISVDKNQINFNRQSVLENMIFRLRKSFQKQFCLTDGAWWYITTPCLRFPILLNDLYKKASCSKFERIDSKEIKHIFHFEISNLIIWILALASLLSLLFNFYVPSNFQLIGKIASASLLSISFILISTKKTSYIYEKDYCNLESDLINLMEKNGKLSFVFVIDELDLFKAPNGPGIVEKDSNNTIIFPLLKTYKNIFHFIEATFIVIADEEVYEKIEKEDLYSTLFTDDIFVFLPSRKELDRYFDNIIKKKDDDTWSNNLEIFKNYILWSGKGNIRKIIKAIKDFDQNSTNKIVFNIESKNLSQSKAFKLMFEYYESIKDGLRSQEYNNREKFTKLYQIIDDDVWTNHGKPFKEALNEDQEFLFHLLGGVLERIYNQNDAGFIIKYKPSSSPESISSSFRNPVPHEEKLINKFKEANNLVISYGKKLGVTPEELIQISKEESEIDFQHLKKCEDLLSETFNLDQNTRKTSNIIVIGQSFIQIPVLEDIIKRITQDIFKYWERRLKTTDKWTLKFKHEGNETDGALLKQLNLQQNTELYLTELFNVLGINIIEKLDLSRHLIFYNRETSNKFIIVIDDHELRIAVKHAIESSGFSNHMFVISNSTDISDLRKWFLSRYIHFKKTKMIVESGVAQLLDDSIVLHKLEDINKDTSGCLQTFLRFDRKAFPLILEAEIELLENNSIFNFFFDYTQNNQNEIRFYMCRIDTRIGDKNADGILLKNYSSVETFWNYINKDQDKHSFANQALKVRIVYTQKMISFYKFIGKRIILIDKINNELGIHGDFGFFNESQRAKVSNLSIRSIPSKTKERQIPLLRSKK